MNQRVSNNNQFVWVGKQPMLITLVADCWVLLQQVDFKRGCRGCVRGPFSTSSIAAPIVG